MVVRQKGQGTGLATRQQWQTSGYHRLLPPGLPHVSCVSLLEALAVDSVEDSWCFLQQAFGSPYLGEWAPSAHLGWPPTMQVRDKESKIKSNTSLTTNISQLQYKVMSQLTKRLSCCLQMTAFCLMSPLQICYILPVLLQIIASYTKKTNPYHKINDAGNAETDASEDGGKHEASRNTDSNKDIKGLWGWWAFCYAWEECCPGKELYNRLTQRVETLWHSSSLSQAQRL